MKGKQLSLQEVLNLKDGSVVWVEDASKIFEDDLYIYDKENIRVNLLTKESKHGYDLKTIGDFRGRIKFYEWVEDGLKIPDQIEEPYYSQSVVESMANEIARHRYPNKYEYDDKLIEMIIKEFS